mgnify:FL=1
MINARDFAIRAHGNQRYGGHAYVLHLDQVVATLKEFGYNDPAMINAGYLHDVLEDTNVSFKELKERFSIATSLLVFAVTAVGDTRESKTQYTIKNLQINKAAIPLKMADRLSNMRFSAANSRKHIETYRKELPLYRELFEKTNSRKYEEMVKL